MQEKKAGNRKKIAGTKEEKKIKPASVPGKNIIDSILVLLYVLAEFVPRFDAVDVMGAQWLYLAILNVGVSAWLLKKRKFIPDPFFKTLLFFFYIGFILIAGLSFFSAYNVIESIVTYSRLIISFIAFLNILSIVSNDPKILKSLFLMIGVVVLYQSLVVLTSFFGNLHGTQSVDALINSIKGNTGNKNILAASMVIKIPFLIYAIHVSRLPLKIFFSLSLFLCVTALLIVNARASFIGLFMEVMIYFILSAIIFLKNERKIYSLGYPALVTGILFLSVFCVQLIFSSLESQKKVSNYGGLAKRVESISLSNEGSSERVLLWKNAVDFIQRNPLLGGGYGNWKIHSCSYERYWQPGWGACMGHVHNDFLEMFADTGFAGGLAYGGIFFLLFGYAFIMLKSPKISLEKKMFLGIAAMSLAAYSVDSFFNFPLERPSVQTLFALSTAILSFSYIDYKKEETTRDVFNIHKKSMVAILLFSCASVYITFEVFKSMQVQDKISVEWIGKPREAKFPFKSGDINPYLPWIPNINGSGMPIACVKAKYLCQEKKYEEALAILNADKGSNPYLYFAEYLRSMTALSLNQPDSAYYYAKYAFYHRPANLQLFNYLNGLAAERKDTAELEKSFIEITRYFPRPDLWLTYSESVFYATGNDEKRLNVIETGLKKYPGDYSLLYKKYFLEGSGFFKTKEYGLSINRFENALKYQPDDKFTKRNIGFAFINLGKYNEGVTVFSDLINNKQFTDGKNEYLRGVCYENLGKTDSACSDFKVAKSLGYDVNPVLLQSCR